MQILVDIYLHHSLELWSSQILSWLETSVHAILPFGETLEKELKVWALKFVNFIYNILYTHTQ